MSMCAGVGLFVACLTLCMSVCVCDWRRLAAHAFACVCVRDVRDSCVLLLTTGCDDTLQPLSLCPPPLLSSQAWRRYIFHSKASDKLQAQRAARRRQWELDHDVRLHVEMAHDSDRVPLATFNAKHAIDEHIRLMPKRARAAKRWLLTRSSAFQAMVKRLQRERRIKSGKMVAVERIDDWLQLS